MFYDAEQITDTLKLYMQVNGCCLVLVLLRMMKMLDFQPRLGIVTKTIAHALSDIIHFFMVLALILGPSLWLHSEPNSHSRGRDLSHHELLSFWLINRSILKRW